MQSKALIGLIALLLVSFYKSCTEIRYTVSGVETEASYDGVEESQGRKGRVTYYAAYTFIAEVEGEQQYGRGGRAHSTQDAAQREVDKERLQVVYLPAQLSVNRPVDESQIIWILITLAVLAGAGVMGVKVWRDAMADVRRDRAR